MSRSERRELQKKLRKVEQDIWDIEVMFSGGAPTVNPRGREQRDKIKKLIEQHDSRELEKQAERFGIEIPTRPDWYSTDIKTISQFDQAYVNGQDTVIDRWLNETGRTMIAKQLRDARFSYWKGWADLLIPILALIVAALALLKDIIVEVLKG